MPPPSCPRPRPPPGHETTAAVLTWTLYLLACHPEYAAKVREEVDAVIGDKAPGE